MNELKCKAKHIDSGDWIYGYFVKYPDGTASIFPEEEWASYPVDPDTCCKSIGEHDKNYRELFVGDMINDFGGGTWIRDEENHIEGQAFPEMICVGDKTRIGIIVTEDGTTRIRNNDASYSFNISKAYAFSDMEYIGNIYD